MILPSVYAGNIQYFSKIAHYGSLTLEACGHYLRQTFRTRCRIAGAEGPLYLTVPVERGELEKPFDRDIRVADTPWQKLHWGAITAAYGKSPFLDYLADDLRPVFERRYTFLWDVQQDMLRFLLQNMGIEAETILTREFAPLSGDDGRLLANARHPLPDPHFRPVPYYQVFAGKYGFIPNLSALDLLFNMGPESLAILRNSYLP